MKNKCLLLSELQVLGPWFGGNCTKRMNGLHERSMYINFNSSVHTSCGGGVKGPEVEYITSLRKTHFVFIFGLKKSKLF
jgi:hypothetical protein